MLCMEQQTPDSASPSSDTNVKRDVSDWCAPLAASGLLRLLRPFQWQHLHVPLLPMSCRHVLSHAVEAKEPFLIGTYTSVLER